MAFDTVSVTRTRGRHYMHTQVSLTVTLSGTTQEVAHFYPNPDPDTYSLTEGAFPLAYIGGSIGAAATSATNGEQLRIAIKCKNIFDTYSDANIYAENITISGTSGFWPVKPIYEQTGDGAAINPTGMIVPPEGELEVRCFSDNAGSTTDVQIELAVLSVVMEV